MLEYVLALAGLLVVISLLFGIIALTIRYAERTENLVSAEYP